MKGHKIIIRVARVLTSLSPRPACLGRRLDYIFHTNDGIRMRDACWLASHRWAKHRILAKYDFLCTTCIYSETSDRGSEVLYITAEISPLSLQIFLNHVLSTFFVTRGSVTPCCVKSGGAGLEPELTSWSTPSARVPIINWPVVRYLASLLKLSRKCSYCRLITWLGNLKPRLSAFMAYSRLNLQLGN